MLAIPGLRCKTVLIVQNIPFRRLKWRDSCEANHFQSSLTFPTPHSARLLTEDLNFILVYCLSSCTYQADTKGIKAGVSFIYRKYLSPNSSINSSSRLARR